MYDHFCYLQHGLSVGVLPHFLCNQHVPKASRANSKQGRIHNQQMPLAGADVLSRVMFKLIYLTSCLKPNY